MMRLQHFAFSQIHMHAARQTRIETPHRAHDVNALEFLRAVLFEDRSILHGILIRSWSAVNIPRIRVPGRRRIGMIIRNLALADYDVMREYAANCLVEAATNGFLRNFEVRPGFSSAGVEFFQRSLRKIESRRGRIGLEVCSGTVSLDSIAPLWNLPFKLNL